jgi:hypothetical protein
MTREELLARLKANEPSFPDSPYRLVPARFDPDDSQAGAFPLAADWRWRSCERLLQSFGARAVLLRLPLFWQVVLLVHGACRSAGAALFVNEQENMPVGAAAIGAAETNVVITDADDAARFAAFLREKLKPLPDAWIIIHPEHAEGGLPILPAARVAEEVHLFPGVPFLTQCDALAARPRDGKASLFHSAEGCVIDEGGAHVSIAGTPIPIEHLALSRPLKAAGTCACGEPLFKRL